MEYEHEFKIAELISRKRLEQLQPDEQKKLDDWLNQSAKHQEIYQRIISGTVFCKRVEIEKQTDHKKVYTEIENKIKQKNIRQWFVRSVSVAAILVMGIFSVYLIRNNPAPEPTTMQTLVIKPGEIKAILTLYNGEKQMLSGDEQPVSSIPANKIVQTTGGEMKPMYNKIEIPRGGEYRLQLSDGTVVWLNSESMMEYPVVFAAAKRTVKLSGEAYFEVKRDTTRPFEIVTNENIHINVLGTTFNVHSYNDRSDILITLVSGAVAVGHGNSRAVLRPNQQAVFNRGKQELSVHEVPDASAYCSWKNGMFCFENESIDVILDALSKWYDVKIEYHGIEVDRLGHFSMNIDRSESFTPILAMLKQVTGLNYRVQGKTVFLSPPKE